MEYNKSKYFFIGWVIGIIPYAILLFILKHIEVETEAYQYVICILTIVVPLINAHLFCKQAKEASLL